MIITVTLLSTLTTTQFRLLAFVTCTSVSSTTLCQVAAAGCCAADFKGSTRYAIERFVSEYINVPHTMDSPRSAWTRQTIPVHTCRQRFALALARTNHLRMW